ncbi:peptidoglycan glycosyltransferase FtsI, partial [Klebsiella pneumoniae]|nr:peptidoglycan glycosyltransferase FtsI [Klebsiella pneumoniae]
ASWADQTELPAAGGGPLATRGKALADALKMPLDQLATRINTNPRMRFIYLARQVNPDMAEYIKKLKRPGIHLREES